MLIGATGKNKGAVSAVRATQRLKSPVNNTASTATPSTVVADGPHHDIVDEAAVVKE